MTKSEIQIAQWLIDPDKRQKLPSDIDFLKNKLEEYGLKKIFYEIELPLEEILKDMNKVGIKTDRAYLKKLSQELTKKINRLEKEVHEKTGFVFNLNSPKQLSDILFKELGISTKGVSKTKTGVFSTSAENLWPIKDRHPAIPLLLEYRELFKLSSTYVEPLLNLADEKKRVHTTFLQTETATGRLSSVNPNLQNIPVIGEWGKKLRRAFIVEKGFSLVSFDYSQIELRILASVSNDREMINAFKNDLDIHALTASKIFNVGIKKVTPEMRRLAKTLNFGIVYGMGPRALAMATDFDFEKAEKFIAEYFEGFPGIKKWQMETLEKARAFGYVENLNHRRRWVPDIVSLISRAQKEAERMAINMPIQSLAADIIKMAMIKIARELERFKWWKTKTRMLLSIHDELLFEINNGILKKAIDLIKSEMESAYQLAVPLKAEVSIGKNWGDARPI